MKKFVFTALALCMFAASAFAQGTTTGRLVGVVSSPDGVIPGANVVVTDNQTGRERTVVTNEEGAYTVPQLDVGTYTVKFTTTGFRAYRHFREDRHRA